MGLETGWVKILPRNLNKFCSSLRKIEDILCPALFRIISISCFLLSYESCQCEQCSVMPWGALLTMWWQHQPIRGREADNTVWSQPIRGQYWQQGTNGRAAGPGSLTPDSRPALSSLLAPVFSISQSCQSSWDCVGEMMPPVLSVGDTCWIMMVSNNFGSNPVLLVNFNAKGSVTEYLRTV